MSDDIDRSSIAEQIRDVLQNNYKDVRHVELETAAAIANRVMGWAKVFGFFAGIPLVLIAVWLGWIGYKSISDLEKLQDQIAALQTDVISKQAQLAKLKELDSLEQRLTSLATRVKSLEVKFSGSADVGTDARRRIEDVLTRYQAHFASLGVRFAANQETNIRIEKSDVMAEKNSLAYYDPEKNEMVVSEDYIANDDVVLREYTHLVLALANPDAKAMGTPNLYALESGLADYFSRSFAGSPAYESLPERTLANDLKIRSARDFADAHTVGLAWGAFAWDLREKLGTEATDRLLLEVWKTPGWSRASNLVESFVTALFNVDDVFNEGANEKLLRTLLVKHGVVD